MRAGVAGASGYSGSELLRLLAGHPHLEPTVVTSREFAGRRMGAIHFDSPLLDTPSDYETTDDPAEPLSACGDTDLATPVDPDERASGSKKKSNPLASSPGGK